MGRGQAGCGGLVKPGSGSQELISSKEYASPWSELTTMLTAKKRLTTGPRRSESTRNSAMAMVPPGASEEKTLARSFLLRASPSLRRLWPRVAVVWPVPKSAERRSPATKVKRSERLKRATVFWVMGMMSPVDGGDADLRWALREGDAPDAGAGGEIHRLLKPVLYRGLVTFEERKDVDEVRRTCGVLSVGVCCVRFCPGNRFEL